MSRNPKLSWKKIDMTRSDYFDVYCNHHSLDVVRLRTDGSLQNYWTIQDQTRLIYRTEQRAQVNMVTNIDTTKDRGDKNTQEQQI